jgi:hypothetical protein
MKRSGKILIWLACGMVFCAISRADDAVNPNTPESSTDLFKQIRQATSAQDRMLLLKKLHAKHPMPTMHPMPGLQMAQPGNDPLNVQASHVPSNNTQADSAQTDTPYGSIAVRNVFGLNPIPPPAPPQDPNAIPPPKITLTGITTIFGPAEALYKVAGYAKNGKQVPDQSYILTEGEEQDDVEVTAIDTQKDTVTFNNHGQTQVLPLSNGVATGGDSGSGPSRPRFGGPGHPNIPNFNNLPESVRQRLQQRFGNMNDGSQNNNNFNPAGQYNSNTTDNNSSFTQNQSGLSGDDQAALISAQHAQLEQQGNPMAALFPPTQYDDQARQEASGSSRSGTSAPPPGP